MREHLPRKGFVGRRRAKTARASAGAPRRCTRLHVVAGQRAGVVQVAAGEHKARASPEQPRRGHDLGLHAATRSNGGGVSARLVRRGGRGGADAP